MKVILAGGRDIHLSLAGFNRNRQMAEYADALIVFRGGKGTQDMVKQAEFKNLKIGKAYDGFSRQRMLEW